MIDRVCWNITSLCNDDCQFCFRMRDMESLGLNDAIKVIELLADNGIKHIAISGGEALLYKHIFSIMEKIKSVGIELTLISNGILLATDEILYKVLEITDWIALPLDTLIYYNKLYTRNPNHYNNIVRILNIVEHKSSAKVKINTVVSTVNYLEIKEIYDRIIKQYECIKRWNLFEFTELRGSAKLNGERFSISTTEDEIVLRQLKELEVINRPIRIKYKHKNTLTQSYIVIMPDGSVVKENLSETKIIGNILLKDLKTMIRELDIDYRLYEKRTSNTFIEII